MILIIFRLTQTNIPKLFIGDSEAEEVKVKPVDRQDWGNDYDSEKDFDFR